MHRYLAYATVGLIGLVTWGVCTPVGVAAAPVGPAEQAQWVRWLLPLPKEVAIAGQVELPAAAVKLTLAEGSGDVVQTAADELRSLLGKRAGEASGAGRFEIVLGVCDASGRLDGVAVPDAARLADLPNAAQAYVIRPLGDARLVLAALDERGVYYAAQTLRQLLEGGLREGRVTIPLATITDWPDLAERGEWGGSANRDVVWMAQHKMNLVESHVTLGMTEDGRGRAAADPELVDLGRRHGLKLVPVITHLNGLGRTGIYRAYPELQGKGEKAVHPTHTNLVAPCCSQPKLTEILADWMIALGDQAGVTDVCAWLSELSNQHCDCQRCRKAGVGQYALETRCLVAAYRLAQKKHPGLKLRILLTQGSYASNDKVLAEIPPDVGVTYYDGGRTYDSSRDPMIYSLLEQYAAKGRWLGCCPQFTASWTVVCPWTGPQFIRCRMTEFVDKKLSCVIGFATPNNRLYDFNITAAAEWSWNAHGRSEGEFSAAWATRKGLKDPEAAAEWAVLLGPVGWDVYGSQVPFDFYKGEKVVESVLLKQRKEPRLGEGIFLYYPDVGHFDDNIAVTERALEIARKVDSPLLVAETLVIQGYTKLLKHIYLITRRLSMDRPLDKDDRGGLVGSMTELARACLQTTTAMQQWEGMIGKRSGMTGIGGHRFRDTIKCTQRTVIAVGEELKTLGIDNNVAAYLSGEAANWEIRDSGEPVE